MASGNLSLTLADDVSWESFPARASEFLQTVRGRCLFRVDSGAERIWLVLVAWRPFFLTFDDLPLGMNLESLISPCNPVIRRLHEQLAKGVF